MAAIRCGFALAMLFLADSATGAPFEAVNGAVAWGTDYRAVLETARAANGMVFLWFYDPAADKESQRSSQELLERCLTSSCAFTFVAVRLPTDVPLPDAAPATGRKLLDHEAFAELRGGAGIAILDMRDENSPQFHRVVSIYPFVHGPIGAEELSTMLELPAGSLTQRTLIWAVRTHSDDAAGASGEFSPLLAQEAAAHSRRQAAMNVQGHHEWEARFHAINAQLPAELVAQEVCAESWPGQDLVAAARGCVASWRQSSGHWDAVRTNHPQFGFDMRRGSSGVWYATGIFGRRR